MFKVNKLFIVLGILLAALISRADRVDTVKTFKRGTVFLKSVPNEIELDDAKEAADEGKLTWECSEVEAFSGKIAKVSGTKVYTTGPLTGHRSKYLARKAANDTTVYQCQSVCLNKHTDTLRKCG